ncbi:hypothetical protein JQN72_06725 [Phycicoccus sp. CSK15P-2]|uniref:hypothetical protein n=1 Tax=Phycicoccus sp. CSK15P-2 TaxID=2807627 RepID=UPI00194F0234|nr:hypothetical protein [Phycicoccus sp. CSK15P-2]MBM6403937.1 hypothetical protein [Phycicoccus sp. CSK15P-2]
MAVMRVRTIHTFPQRGEDGVLHDTARVDAHGVEGDRPKKAAVSLVGHDSPHTRANLVLDAPTSVVEALAGQVLRVGEVLLAVEPTGNHCAGLYASVGAAGTVRSGDVVEVVGDTE